jgi:hypothetical protein
MAKTAVEADAMATAMNVMSIEKSLAFCKVHDEYACLIVDRDGKQFASHNWPASKTVESVPSAMLTAEGMGWPKGAELKVDFEINRPGGGRYQRPYVAVWIEDEAENPVRTLMLLLMQDNPGPRWYRDLKRWHKKETIRTNQDLPSMVTMISVATKPPGKYSAVWDGTDDQWKPVARGKYFLFIEAAREHGTYQLIKQEITIGSEPVSGELKGNTEIKAASYEYHIGG